MAPIIRLNEEDVEIHQLDNSEKLFATGSNYTKNVLGRKESKMHDRIETLDARIHALAKDASDTAVAVQGIQAQLTIHIGGQAKVLREQERRLMAAFAQILRKGRKVGSPD